MKPDDKRRQGGFNNLPPERRKEIASMGGKASQRNGHAHRFNSQTGKEAGKKMQAQKKAKLAAELGPYKELV